MQFYSNAGSLKGTWFLLLLLSVTMASVNGQNTSISTDMVPIGGTNSLAVGFEALRWNSGIANTALGHKSLQQNTSGIANTAAGFQSLIANTSGGANTGIGYLSLFANTMGGGNSALGYQALANNTTGHYNTGIGYQTLYSSVGGFGNTGVGNNALYMLTSGKNNTAIGDSAGFNTVGDGLVLLGKMAGIGELGSNKLYISNAQAQTILYGDFVTGQLLVGNKTPANYQFRGKHSFNVIGGIRADSIRVAPITQWADHVFGDDYDLISIKELDTFIKTHQHLPNIPSAVEVSANGLEIGNFYMRILQKVEELTLYVIQQEKKLNEQQQLIDQLRKKSE
jgi:trimeric autotransporter adhesin